MVITGYTSQDVIKLLQGRTAGIQITALFGFPWGGVSFVFRGNNLISGSVSPLYVIDGVFMKPTFLLQEVGGNLLSNPLADITPADKRITLLNTPIQPQYTVHRVQTVLF